MKSGLNMCSFCLTRGRADTQVFTVRKAEREEACTCVETTLLTTLRRLQGSGITGSNAEAHTGEQSSRGCRYKLAEDKEAEAGGDVSPTMYWCR